MDIRILGAHNSESINSSCVTFIIDDKLAVEAGGLTSHLTVREQHNIEAVILTHHHMDHIRDIPCITYNFYTAGTRLDIYATAVVNDVIRNHLLNDMIYPEFQKIPEKRPTIHFLTVEPYGKQWINGFNVLPIPVTHGASAVGYQISSKEGKSVFYTGDTGPGLADCWRHVSPNLLIIDVTLTNGLEDTAIKGGHLTPHLLEQELLSFKKIRGYLPQVVTIHMDISMEPEIKQGLASVEKNLGIPIQTAYEGMLLHV